MSTIGSTSNVYFLAPAAPEPVPAARDRRRLPARLRLLAFWWRLRLTGRDIADSLRRFGRPQLDNDTVYLEQRAEMIVPVPRVPAGPARVISLDDVRRRRASS